jgi:hypothetical protein
LAGLAAGPGPALAKQARGEAAELRHELEQLYRDVDAGDVSPVIATRHEKGLLARIGEAEQRAQEATVPRE